MKQLKATWHILVGIKLDVLGFARFFNPGLPEQKVKSWIRVTSEEARAQRFSQKAITVSKWK